MLPNFGQFAFGHTYTDLGNCLAQRILNDPHRTTHRRKFVHILDHP